jgi:hypothetical protein
MIKSTDKLVSMMPAIYVSQGVRSNKMRANNAMKVVLAIENTLPAFKQLLSIPDNIKFRICTFKGSVRGMYMNDTKTVCITPMSKWENVMLTLAHELVHAEQFHTGRLEHVKIPRKGYRFAWYGSVGSKGTTRNAYLNQPWEKEAFGRQQELADKVLEMLEGTEESNDL